MLPLGDRRVQTEMLLAHEYTHHVQKLLGVFPKSRLALTGATEGHARGVERLWAEQRTRHGQGARFEFHQLSFRLPELRRTYVALCERHGTIPKESLLGDTPASKKPSEEMDPRDYGYALFRACELGKGQGIYRDLIRGELAIRDL